MIASAPDEERRAQVGIGTLILFVAMVLIAVLAAGVLMNTAGVLQSQAEATGQESTAEISNTVDVYTAVGDVNEDTEIEAIDITVGLGAGSNPIDLDNIVIDYLGPGGHTFITDVPVNVDGTDSSVLETGGDRATITAELEGEEEVEPLEQGDAAVITIITNDGAQITVQLTTPTILEAEQPVRL
ncbi:archaellin/type IV pilin N-terminal domain-containing protein [Halostagnicola sp. A-GB9-2]|uniref:archaellin/type IV pilin N-terminal domain-containing protein n=1 Tax=Halostagnicola sp. A-GB9-2 TaxID=3048066 RepID=UPI0024BF3399|nr:archaellin/type IV pilin N-terminal domain-containing protein [Halostagnicola sp. A-GB9-2]MDJ1434290.1 flagellin A2 [Halostagnicola sp. A-GB9-2]